MQTSKADFLAAGANRKFYDISDASTSKTSDDPTEDDVHVHSPKGEDTLSSGSQPLGRDICEYINQNVIGKDKVFCGPFGLRQGKMNARTLLRTIILIIATVQRILRESNSAIVGQYMYE